MGFWSSVGSIASSIAGGISRAVSTIGSGLSSFTSGVGTVIGGIASTLKPVGKALGGFASSFLQGLGVFKKTETVEDIGDRALQAAEDGITMDKIDGFENYMDALRNFEPNPDKSKGYSSEKKLVAGLGVGTKGIEEKFNAEPGSLDSMWLLPMANSEYFTPERMQGLVSTGRLCGDTFAYLEKRLTGGENRTFEKTLELDENGNALDVDKRSELYQALEDAQDNWGNMMDKIDGSNQ